LLSEAKAQLDEYNIPGTKRFIQQAHDKEQGQMYGDRPYSEHPRQVAAVGRRFFGPRFNAEAVKVALLHDVLEDTPYKPEDLAERGYSPTVIQAVQLLTKDKSLSYFDNIRKIINSKNLLAMMVKYCDNYVNYTGDKSHWTPERAAASQEKYLASLNMLGDVLGVEHHVQESFAENIDYLEEK
jgi:(p)ppGpp synthase/HD superfamily hydrolase